MPPVLKPDMKAVVWLLIGAFALPKIMAVVKSRTS